MLRIILDNNKSNKGVSNDTILKIKILHKGIGIAVSGFGGLSDTCIIYIQSISKAKLDSTVEANVYVVVLDKEKWFEMAINEKDEFIINPHDTSMI